MRRSERPRLGILGGGQLAAMLADAALRQGVRPVVLTGSPSDPAARDGVELVLGRLDDPEALERLFASCDTVTLENEFVDTDLLQEVLDRHPGVSFQPGLPCVRTAQDKLRQKALLDRLGIPSADHRVLALEDLPAELSEASRAFPEGFMLKWARFGYDGIGNLLVDPHSPPAFDEVRTFCDRARRAGARVFAERRIDHAQELAVVATRGLDGVLRTFPLVVSHQERSVCRTVVGPATAVGLDPELERQARAHARAIGHELDLVGTFAVEFFLTRDGRLLVNELAPRVHNTGHYSLFGGEVSQFDLHVQAVLGRPLSHPAPRGVFVMRNLLGPRDLDGLQDAARPVDPPPRDTELHWYGKRDLSPGRKMGHLTGRARDHDHALQLLGELEQYERKHWTRCARERDTSDDEDGSTAAEGGHHHGLRLRPAGDAGGLGRTG